MPRVKDYTDKIRTAIYGKDVRSSIADAIDQIDSVAEGDLNSVKSYAQTTKTYQDNAKTYQDNAKTYQDNTKSYRDEALTAKNTAVSETTKIKNDAVTEVTKIKDDTKGILDKALTLSIATVGDLTFSITEDMLLRVSWGE